MRLVIDMNLSPLWVSYLQNAGFDAVHWSTIGSAGAPDHEIVQWAVAHKHIIFTNDLDFSAILAASQANTPSVFQIRTQDLLPDRIAPIVTKSLKLFKTELLNGALVTIDESKSRVRVLPINQ